jgi:hypothetical protein
LIHDGLFVCFGLAAVVISCLGLHWANDLPVSIDSIVQKQGI